MKKQMYYLTKIIRSHYGTVKHYAMTKGYYTKEMYSFVAAYENGNMNEIPNNIKRSFNRIILNTKKSK